VPVRIGIDLVSVASVQESIDRYADRYLHRVYTERELSDCTGADGLDAARLAARFAAKEAAVKVLRPAPDVAVPWSAIEVRRPDGGGGWVELVLREPAQSLAQSARLDGWSVSLSHENGYASAVVAAELPKE
jgi:holo-[acyl-carrier protein] synthase